MKMGSQSFGIVYKGPEINTLFDDIFQAKKQITHTCKCYNSLNCIFLGLGTAQLCNNYFLVKMCCVRVEMIAHLWAHRHR